LLLDLGGFSGTTIGGGGVRIVSSSALRSSDPGTTDQNNLDRNQQNIHTMIAITSSTLVTLNVMVMRLVFLFSYLGDPVFKP
jgi:hypothetical protein